MTAALETQLQGYLDHLTIERGVAANTLSSLIVTEEETLSTASARICAVVMSNVFSSSAILVFHRAMMRFIR